MKDLENTKNPAAVAGRIAGIPYVNREIKN